MWHTHTHTHTTAGPVLKMRVALVSCFLAVAMGRGRTEISLPDFSPVHLNSPSIITDSKRFSKTTPRHFTLSIFLRVVCHFSKMLQYIFNHLLQIKQTAKLNITVPVVVFSKRKCHFQFNFSKCHKLNADRHYYQDVLTSRIPKY